SYQDGSSVYAAGAASGGFGNRNAQHPYYTQFFGGTVESNGFPPGPPGNYCPPGQLALFPQQTGHTAVGAAGFKWRDVQIIKSGNTIVWLLDGHLIATENVSTAGTLGGTNILLGQSD